MLQALKANTTGRWSEGPNGIICNPHEREGGIIDRAIKGNEWFVIFNREDLPSLFGYASRDDAIAAFLTALDKQKPIT